MNNYYAVNIPVKNENSKMKPMSRAGNALLGNVVCSKKGGAVR